MSTNPSNRSHSHQPYTLHRQMVGRSPTGSATRDLSLRPRSSSTYKPEGRNRSSTAITHQWEPYTQAISRMSGKTEEKDGAKYLRPHSPKGESKRRQTTTDTASERGRQSDLRILSTVSRRKQKVDDTTQESSCLLYTSDAADE